MIQNRQFLCFCIAADRSLCPCRPLSITKRVYSGHVRIRHRPWSNGTRSPDLVNQAETLGPWGLAFMWMLLWQVTNKILQAKCILSWQTYSQSQWPVSKITYPATLQKNVPRSQSVRCACQTNPIHRGPANRICWCSLVPRYHGTPSVNFNQWLERSELFFGTIGPTQY